LRRLRDKKPFGAKMINNEYMKTTISFDKSVHYEKFKLKEVLNRVVDPVIVESNVFYEEIGIKSHGKGIFHKTPTTKDEIGNKRVFWLKRDLLIFNIVFAWELAVAKTTKNEEGKIASHRFPMYRVNPNFLDLDYALYFFLTEQGKKLLAIASPGGAGRNKTLGQKAFDNLEVRLPPVEEQRKIAGFINNINSKLTLLNSELEYILQFKKGVLQRMLVGEDKSNLWPFVPLKTLLKEKKLKNLKGIFSKDEVLSVSGKHGIVNQIEHLGRSYAGESILDYNVVNTGDIVYTRSPLKNNPYGIIKSNKGKSGVVSKLYAVFECDDINTSIYIENYFELYDNANRYLRPLVHKGAKNSMNISKQRFLSGSIELPPLKKQIIFNEFKLDIDKKVFNLEARIEAFKEFKSGLLQSLYIKRS
jgi:type I restriction enzyme, S subunit